MDLSLPGAVGGVSRFHGDRLWAGETDLRKCHLGSGEYPIDILCVGDFNHSGRRLVASEAVRVSTMVTAVAARGWQFWGYFWFQWGDRGWSRFAILLLCGRYSIYSTGDTGRGFGRGYSRYRCARVGGIYRSLPGKSCPGQSVIYSLTELVLDIRWWNVGGSFL